MLHSSSGGRAPEISIDCSGASASVERGASGARDEAVGGAPGEPLLTGLVVGRCGWSGGSGRRISS